MLAVHWGFFTILHRIEIAWNVRNPIHFRGIFSSNISNIFPYFPMIQVDFSVTLARGPRPWPAVVVVFRRRFSRWYSISPCCSPRTRPPSPTSRREPRPSPRRSRRRPGEMPLIWSNPWRRRSRLDYWYDSRWGGGGHVFCWIEFFWIFFSVERRIWKSLVCVGREGTSEAFIFAGPGWLQLMAIRLKKTGRQNANSWIFGIEFWWNPLT